MMVIPVHHRLASAEKRKWQKTQTTRLPLGMIAKGSMRKKNSLKTKDGTTPRDVDEYLASVPEAARSALKKMRAVIQSCVPPEATETISYKIPAIKYKGMLVWFAGFSDHCSLFPTAAVIDAFKDELQGYQTAKGTIRFPLDKPLPVALLKKIVKARVAQVRASQIEDK
jgi:uncharacterized protein YdhG (YjbR/CyaY superfamily)